MSLLYLFGALIVVFGFVYLASRLSDGGSSGGRVNLSHEGWYLQLPSQCNKDEPAHINLWGPAEDGYGVVCYGAINVEGADSSFGPNRVGIPGVSREVLMDARAAAGRYSIPLCREYWKRSGRY